MVIIATTRKYAHITHLSESGRPTFTKSFKWPTSSSRARLHRYIHRHSNAKLVKAVANNNGVTKYYVSE